MDFRRYPESNFCSTPIKIRSLFPIVVLLSLFSTLSESNQFCDAGIGIAESQCGAASTPPSKILIKGGTVVNSHHQEIADVYIEDGIVLAVQPNIKVGDGVTIIDATGKYVMPGVIWEAFS